MSLPTSPSIQVNQISRDSAASSSTSTSTSTSSTIHSQFCSISNPNPKSSSSHISFDPSLLSLYLLARSPLSLSTIPSLFSSSHPLSSSSSTTFPSDLLALKGQTPPPTSSSSSHSDSEVDAEAETKRRRNRKRDRQASSSTDDPSSKRPPSSPSSPLLSSSSSSQRYQVRCSSPSHFSVPPSSHLLLGPEFSLDLPSRIRLDSLFSSLSSLYYRPKPVSLSSPSLVEIESEYGMKHYTTLDTLVSGVRKKSCIEKWNVKELALFEAGMGRFGKDFGKIARSVRTKTTAECVQLYYDCWKMTDAYLQWKKHRFGGITSGIGGGGGTHIPAAAPASTSTTTAAVAGASAARADGSSETIAAGSNDESNNASNGTLPQSSPSPSPPLSSSSPAACSSSTASPPPLMLPLS